MMTPTDLTNVVEQGQDAKAQLRVQVPPSAKGTKWLGVAIKSLLLALLVFVALEILLRLAHVGEQEYLKVDPLLGLAHLENKLVTDRSEAFAVSRINSAGLCDVEHLLAKSAGVIRVAVLGDSMTEALQVPTEARFARLLENKLNASDKSGRRFEVINFGNGAFSTGQEYLQFVQTVAAYRPDLTVLMFHQGDQEKNPPTYSNWSLRPTFTINGQRIQIRWKEFDRWRTSESALPLTLFDWGRRHSCIWGVLLQTHSVVKNDPLFVRVFGRAGPLLNALSSSTELNRGANNTREIGALRKELANHTLIEEDTALLPGKDSISPTYRWQLTLSLLNLLSSKCNIEGSKFMVASLPATEQRKAFQAEFQTVDALAKRCEFTTLDLTPQFEKAANQKIDPLFLTGHLSRRGHDLVANQLCDKISSMQPTAPKP